MEYKNETTAIINIKNKNEAKNKKLEAATNRLKTKLSCTRKQETEDRIIKLNNELKELEKEIEEQKLREVEVDKIKTYVSLAPTNLAALIIDGITIHKFCCVCKSYDILKVMKFKYIFLDEVSMLQERFYKFLLMIKKLKPETKFIISGDYSQLSPVADRISPNYNYAHNPAIYE